jgi:hypothetical protein
MIQTRRSWTWWARFELWLEGLAGWSAPRLFGGFLAWFMGWSVLVGVLMHNAIPDSQEADLATIAGRLMPVVGSLFALLTAFVITNQWNRSRDAEKTVGKEADASVRLALATSAPHVDGPGLRRHLLTYLQSLLAEEWHTLRHDAPGSLDTARHLRHLQRAVRDAALAPTVPTPVTSDLLTAAEAVAVTRRDRLNLAGHGLPAPLFLLAFLSGVVVCLNAIAIAVQFDSWVALIIVALVVTVALDLALVVAISAPFRGSISVVPTPITAVVADFGLGQFGAVADVPS